MSKSAASIVASLCTLLAICSTFGFILYSCSNADDRYYKAMNDCINQGGSWIPSSSGGSSSYTASCVFGRGK